MLSAQEIAELGEIQRLMDEAYANFFTNSPDPGKSSEGSVTVNFNDYWDRTSKSYEPGDTNVREVTIYSYILGPDMARLHHFESTRDALDAIRSWHADEMAHDYEADRAADAQESERFAREGFMD